MKRLLITGIVELECGRERLTWLPGSRLMPQDLRIHLSRWIGQLVNGFFRGGSVHASEGSFEVG